MVSGSRSLLIAFVTWGVAASPTSGQSTGSGQDQQNSAAGSKPRKIEEFRGGVRSDGKGSRTVTSIEQRRVADRVRRAEKALQRQLAAVTEQSQSLARQSFDAFRRGLMPLPDHLEQLKLGQRAELLTATTEEEAEAIQQRHIARLDSIVGALREFNQPNAEGWNADLLLAQALAAQARSQLATMQKRDGDAQAARQSALELAESHLERRRADSTIGWATVPMMVNARLVVQQIRQDEPYTSLPAGEFLDDAITLTRSWQERGAGIGRADRVALAEYQQARFALRHSMDRDTAEIAAVFRRADVAALRLYDQKRTFLRTGTASLYDVALAWSFRNELSDILSIAELAPPESSEVQMLRDLDALREFARSTRDRRGRIEADVSYVEVLASRAAAIQAYNELDAADQAAAELKQRAAGAQSDGASPPAKDAPAAATRKPVRLK